MQAAYILHRYPYRDTSVLVKLWLRDTGLQTAVMRGVRKLKSRWRGTAQPFLPLQVHLRGKGDVLTVSHCEMIGNGYRFDRQGQAVAFYLNELLLTFLQRQEAMPALFDHYTQVLQGLSQSQPAQPLLRQFEMHLFDELGQGIQLNVDQNNSVLEANAYYHVAPGSLPLKTAAMAANSFSGGLLQAIAKREWDKNSLGAAKQLCRAWVDYYSHGKVFKSRTLLTQ